MNFPLARILSIESWLFNFGILTMVYEIIPIFPMCFFNPRKHRKQPVFFHRSIWNGEMRISRSPVFHFHHWEVPLVDRLDPNVMLYGLVLPTNSTTPKILKCHLNDLGKSPWFHMEIDLHSWWNFQLYRC